jgi:vancomycin resistance protein YoaR
MLKMVWPWKAKLKKVRLPASPLVRSVMFWGTIACLGALAGLVVSEPWLAPVSPVDKIRVGKVDVPTGEPRAEALVRHARGRLQANVKLLASDFQYVTSWADLGATVDLKTLGEILRHLGAHNSPSARYLRRYGKRNATPSVALPITLGADAAVESLATLKEVIDKPPLEAKFDFKKGVVIPEEMGRSLDVYNTLVNLDAALARGDAEVEMAVDQVAPAITKDRLREIDVSEVVGFFSTPYSRMIKDKHRTYNVKLGASRLDGQVILPGEVFSFNHVLGERSEARGFRYAPVIAGGVLVEGMGGGTCQVASTLYAAAFFAGLVVAERQTHSRPSSYIKLGLDATVSYPDLDLKLKNPFDFPVAIHFTAEEGSLRAEIRGKRRPYTVTLLRKVVGQQPFQTRYVEDPHLLQGKEVVTQNGIPGYTVRRFQIVEADKVGYRFQTVDKYPPTLQFVHRGTAPSSQAIDAKSAPKPDNHKPYRAATYLRMVQGPDGLWYERSHE